MPEITNAKLGHANTNPAKAGLTRRHGDTEIS